MRLRAPIYETDLMPTGGEDRDPIAGLCGIG